MLSSPGHSGNGEFVRQGTGMDAERDVVATQSREPDPPGVDQVQRSTLAPPRITRSVLGFAAVVGLALTWLYRTQPDELAALTVIPAWCWLLPALALLVLTRPEWRSSTWRACLLATLLFAGLCVEQTRSLPRQWLSPAVSRTTGAPVWRVVSLNCYVGTAEVIEDLVPLQPDLVLLQESPTRDHLEAMARRLFGDEGSIVSTGDGSIVARGRLAVIPAPFDARFAQARWQPVTGPEVLVVSLRLTPPSTRLDYWRRTCWRRHRQTREQHRKQIEELVAALHAAPTGLPIIVGGDFNSPARDAALWPLQTVARDSFETAGRGWGSTFSRDFPFHRIDQVWLSDDLHPLNVQTSITPHSDHRAVVCDVRWGTAATGAPPSE